MKKLIFSLIISLMSFGTVAAQCSAYFTTSQAPNTLVVNFTEITNPTNAIMFWDFGDNQTGGGAGVQHQYATPGFYYVCLNIIDSLTNCQASYCDTIFVASGSQICAASFTFSVGANGVVTFTNTSLPSTSGYSFLWDFGDNQTSTQVNPTHTYTATGSYVIFLTMTGGNCYSTYTDTVSVIPNGQPCAALFSVSATSGNTVQFNNESLPSLVGYTFFWDFGDNQTSTSIGASHTYASSGTYVVCLTMFDSTNCQSTFCDTLLVNVNQNPCQAAFSYTQNTSGQIQFTNTSLPSTAGYNFSWNFGDSQTGSAVSPSHTYASAGMYVVCLTMFDSTCQSTFCDSVYVNTVGIDEFETIDLNVYPNPANEFLTLSSTHPLMGSNYRILDLSGRVVLADVVTSSQLSISSLSSGIYLLQIVGENKRSTTVRFSKL